MPGMRAEQLRESWVEEIDTFDEVSGTLVQFCSLDDPRQSGEEFREFLDRFGYSVDQVYSEWQEQIDERGTRISLLARENKRLRDWLNIGEECQPCIALLVPGLDPRGHRIVLNLPKTVLKDDDGWLALCQVLRDAFSNSSIQAIVDSLAEQTPTSLYKAISTHRDHVTLLIDGLVLGKESAAAEMSAATGQQEPRLQEFEGGFRVAYLGETIVLKAGRAVATIAHLIENPVTSFRAEDLLAAVDPPDPSLRAGKKSDQEVLDQETMNRCRRRLELLKEEREDAQGARDEGRLLEIDNEREAIEDELSAFTGLGGRSRNFSGEDTKRWTRLRKRVQRGIEQVSKANPELGEYLTQHIEVRNRTFRYVP